METIGRYRVKLKQKNPTRPFSKSPKRESPKPSFYQSVNGEVVFGRGGSARPQLPKAINPKP